MDAARDLEGFDEFDDATGAREALPLPCRLALGRDGARVGAVFYRARIWSSKSHYWLSLLWYEWPSRGRATVKVAILASLLTALACAIPTLSASAACGVYCLPCIPPCIPD